MTPTEARAEYARHADEPRHVDLTTFCVEVVLAVLGLAALLLVFAGALWIVQFSGGLIW